MLQADLCAAGDMLKELLQLLQQGATLVTSVDEVLRELSVAYMPFDVKFQKKVNRSTCENASQASLKMLGFEMTTLEQFMARSNLSLEQAACSLSELELQGLIKSVPGGYMRCV